MPTSGGKRTFVGITSAAVANVTYTLKHPPSVSGWFVLTPFANGVWDATDAGQLTKRKVFEAGEKQ